MGQKGGYLENGDGRFLILWLSLLPFSLWSEIHWFTAPATAITAFLLLGIEEIGVQIEEPFSLLPLEHYCNRIERGVREVLNFRNGVSNIIPADMKANQIYPPREYDQVALDFQSQFDVANDFLRRL
eukprot:TRINITY_DN4216_c0_g1_i4.p1 TRINITY_DN4216_c0_g1~~TRINITY_DN4216_c0_g1_i4.p1  ORF type:complete len:138 (-),score=13.93 TRINITY_DN4216_c0_g1_i4:408-788(-)